MRNDKENINSWESQELSDIEKGSQHYIVVGEQGSPISQRVKG